MAQNGTQPNRLALASGFGIGILWIATALFILYNAIRGFADHRPDYGMSWSLVGVLLLAAGVAALVGTWWHLIRRPPAHH
jgi:predicted MFS family arabinose efflux permease